MRRCLLAWLCLLVAVAALGWHGAASAHQAMSGWSYPYTCCSDRDCAEVAPEAVREGAGGYQVTIQPGGHPMWPKVRTDPLVLAIPYRESKASPDGHFHLCIDGAGKLLCFFAAIGGS